MSFHGSLLRSTSSRILLDIIGLDWDFEMHWHRNPCDSTIEDLEFGGVSWLKHLKCCFCLFFPRMFFSRQKSTPMIPNVKNPNFQGYPNNRIRIKRTPILAPEPLGTLNCEYCSWRVGAFAGINQKGFDIAIHWIVLCQRSPSLHLTKTPLKTLKTNISPENLSLEDVFAY